MLLIIIIFQRPQVWYQRSKGEWVLGRVLSSSGGESLISLLDDKENLPVKVLRVSADELLPANPEILEGVNDLMQLSYLNEPSVLYNLQYRYSQDMIYVSSFFQVQAFTCPYRSSFFYGKFFYVYRLKLGPFWLP